MSHIQCHNTERDASRPFYGSITFPAIPHVADISLPLAALEFRAGEACLLWSTLCAFPGYVSPQNAFLIQHLGKARNRRDSLLAKVYEKVALRAPCRKGPWDWRMEFEPFYRAHCHLEIEKLPDSGLFPRFVVRAIWREA